MALGLNWFNRARLASGLILFAFLATHLLNHSLGLIGLDAMEAGRVVFLAIWRNWIGALLLYGAVVTHITLVLLSLYRRRAWRSIGRVEIAQIVFGLCIPPLVIEHVLANRGLHAAFKLNDTYAYVVLSLWMFKPWLGVQQAVVVIVAWFHGCIGVHMWLRLKPWYPQWRAALYTIAVLLPVCALFGFMEGSREAVRLYQDPIWRAAYNAAVNLSPDAYSAAVAWLESALGLSRKFMVIVPLIGLAAWVLHNWIERRRGLVTIGYPMGRRVTVRPGTSVLEASRIGGIPHASVCGGRGRCSTCRVRIAEGREWLPTPSDDEVKVLARVGAPEGVRLACQLRPTHDLAVVPLLPATAQPRDGFTRPAYTQGSEREIAILFADLRSFTRFSEMKLPYDVVFVINQYFRAMGMAVERSGGQVDKFIGDGVMALFGLRTDADEGCRQALRAARAMSEALAELNRTLSHDLPEPLRIGIGVHAGTVIVGEMGYARTMSLTAIGDAVNTASRLEQLTKEFGVELVVSNRVAKRAGISLAGFARRDIEVRGRTQPMPIYLVPSGRDLPEDLSQIATAKPAPEAAATAD
ncbi:MAG TPA: adenylate/guanylate cyclase domain-containing protein [Candidatus Cybelea sp.]|nr:adenylate/guanylate cyclase domain-containing protein [Candidatus Cybelea sp.]